MGKDSSRRLCLQKAGWRSVRWNSALAIATALFGFGALSARQIEAQAPVVEKVAAQEAVRPITTHSFGRTKLEADGMYVYQWPGVYFLAAYQGPALYFKTGQGKQNLRVSVDGRNIPVVVDGTPGTYRISTPAGGEHRVRIDVINENAWAPESLGAFSVPAGGKGIHVAVARRQMEFIGDSHTVGYGNTSPTRECSADQVWATTDTSQSLGADTASHYGANYQINAISGHGVVRNYDGGAGDPVPVAYPYLFLDRKEMYEDAGWNPEVIAISLGTNDFSTPLHPAEVWKTRDDLHTAYEQTYAAFVKQLRQRNPHALIILWSTDMSEEEIASEGKKVVQKLRSEGDSRIDFLEVRGLTFTACNYHPSVADDRVVSGKLIEDIDRHKDVWGDSPGEAAASPGGAAILPASAAESGVPPVTSSSPVMAITWDDLPAHDVLPPGETRLDVARKVIAAMQAQHIPPVYGFINGAATIQEPGSEAVLQQCIDAGNLLGNHAWSHMNLNEHNSAEFQEDVEKNEPLLTGLMGSKDWLWFRYPYLAEGKTPEQKQEIRDYLGKKKYKVAEVTMGFPDYDWAAPYARCVAKQDTAAIAQLETEYLQAARDFANFSRRMSAALYGKDIPYVLLLHIGAMEARMLPRLLAQYREMGFSFTTLPEVEADPFYAADIDLSSHGDEPRLETRMFERKLPFPRSPAYPNLDSVCR